MALFKIFDASGNLVMDDDSTVFRRVGLTFIVGSIAGNPNIDGGSGSIVNDGLTTGTPYCRALWAGTVSNGSPSSADPPAPNITFSGNTLNYSSLWGDWWLLYGVA